MKLVRVLLVLLVAVAAGCIKVDQTLTLNKDGSGELAVSYGMSEQTIAQMEAMKEMSKNMAEANGEPVEDDDSPFDFNEDDVREQFAKLKDKGITLKSVKSETRDGWKYMNLVVAFKDMNALAETDFFSDSQLSLTKDADGNYVLLQKSGDFGMGEEGQSPEQQKAMMEQMKPMFAGMRIAMTIKVPTKVLETNATEHNDNSASWIYDIDKDSDALSKMQNDMKLVFVGKGVNLPVINP
jgi:hypothetical protein